MLTLPRSVRIYLATEPTDMRRGFDGLGQMVKQLGLDAFSGHLFAFVSRRGDRIKVLCWDNGGFVLWYKRLEKGRFKIPPLSSSDATVALDGPSLTMLLEGIDYSRVRRPKHWQPKSPIGDRQTKPGVIEAPDDSRRAAGHGQRLTGADGHPEPNHC